MLQTASWTTMQMPTSTQTRYYGTLLICLNAILLIVVYRSLHDPRDVPRSPTTVTMSNESQSVIKSTDESLYVMYGDGNFSDDNQHLLNYIRSMTSRQGPGGRHLFSPSSRVHFSQVGGSEFVDKLLNQRRNGFFVESGAFIGEEYSDTLFFEMYRNWTGILIEPHPDYYREILTKNRRALVLRACLSASRRPEFVKFRLMGWGSGVSSLNKNVDQTNQQVPETHVQCFSLNSIMSAIGVKHVDFMVLDVEGSELPVLQTIDWTRLSVDVFSIEYSIVDNLPKRFEKLNKIRRFFNETGTYKEVGILGLTTKESGAQDILFMRV